MQFDWFTGSLKKVFKFSRYNIFIFWKFEFGFGSKRLLWSFRQTLIFWLNYKISEVHMILYMKIAFYSVFDACFNAFWLSPPQLSYRPQYGLKLGRERSLPHIQIEHFGNQGFQLLIWKPKMGIELLRACCNVAWIASAQFAGNSKNSCLSNT